MHPKSGWIKVSQISRSEIEGILTANIPIKDWWRGELMGAWRSFKQHCKFTFDGPLINVSKTKEQWCNYLIICVRDKGWDIYNTLDKDKAKTFKCFIKKVHPDGESLDQFVTDLQLLVKVFPYKDPDNMVRDREVTRCHLQKAREKLFKKVPRWP